MSQEPELKFLKTQKVSISFRIFNRGHFSLITIYYISKNRLFGYTTY